MSKEDKAKKVLFYKNLFKLITVTIALAIVSYAWFNHSLESKMGGVTVTTYAINEIELSIDEGNTWGMVGQLGIPPDFLFEREVTGDGVNFLRAANKNPVGDPIGFEPAIVNEDYLEFNVMFRAPRTSTMYLEKQSYVNPACGTGAANLLGPNVTRISASGDYSRDLIAGGVRIAFINNTVVEGEFVPDNNVSLIWAPNPNIEMVNNGGVKTPIMNSTNSQPYVYYNSQSVLNPTPNLKDKISADYAINMTGGDPYIAFVEANEVKQITIRIWIEGTDREAVTELKGGHFVLSFSFAGFTKEHDDVPPLVTVAGNQILGYNNTMEHSDNNGVTWIKYETNNSPTFSSGTTVLVRKSETSETFASVFTTLNF